MSLWARSKRAFSQAQEELKQDGEGKHQGIPLDFESWVVAGEGEWEANVSQALTVCPLLC